MSSAGKSILNLPSPMYDASAVPYKEKVYVMAGDTPQIEAYDDIFSYNITINTWTKLPPLVTTWADYK